MDISVIIPTHNRAHLLARALDSVYAQQHAAREVIVVDDGSDDTTADLLRGSYNSVRYFRQSQRGVSAARNLGISKARGTWLALLDSDDAWDPDKLAAQCAVARASPDCRLIHCDERWLRNGKPLRQRAWHRKRGGWIFDDCLPRCVISPSAALLQRSVFTDFGGFDESLPACEDYAYWLHYCAHEPVAFVDRPLLTKYGGHPDQLSHTVPALDRYRIRVLAALLDGGALDTAQARATRSELRRKLDIYLVGAARRGHTEDVAAHQQLRCRLAL